MLIRRPAALVLAFTALLAACTGAGSGGTTSIAPGPTAGPSGTPAATAASPAPTTSAVSPSPTTDVVEWVVFQSPDGLRLIHPVSGTSRRVLPGGPAEALHPDWSPDGSRLAFSVDDPDGTRDIWISDWDGENAVRLVDCVAPCRDADSPAWSPDGERLAFTRVDNVDGHNPGSVLHTVEVGSGEVTTVASTSGAEYAGAARWSPDGRSIVVQLDRFIDDGNDTDELTGQGIGIVDLDGATQSIRIIRELGTFSTYPDWHPTEDVILFAAGARDPLDPADEPSNLFTIRPDGAGVVQLTSQGPDDDGVWMPAFRPDGSGILATRVHADGSLTLVSLAPDGSGLADLDSNGPTYGAHSRQRPTSQP